MEIHRSSGRGRGNLGGISEFGDSSLWSVTHRHCRRLEAHRIKELYEPRHYCLALAHSLPRFARVVHLDSGTRWNTVQLQHSQYDSAEAPHIDDGVGHRAHRHDYGFPDDASRGDAEGVRLER